MIDVANAELAVRIHDLTVWAEQILDRHETWAGIAAALQGELDGKATLSPNKTLAELLRDGVSSYGTHGFAFEYTVHAAIRMHHPDIAPLVAEAVDSMNYGGEALQSLLFVPDRSSPFLLDSSGLTIAPKARVMTGGVGQPPRFNDHLLGTLKEAAMKKGKGGLGPVTAPDLWRADMFVNADGGVRWIPVDVKSHAGLVRPRTGLPLVITAGERADLRRSDGRTVLTLPLSGRGVGIWEDGIRRLEFAKHLVQDKGRFARMVGAVDKPMVKWLISRQERTIGDVIVEAWTRAGVDDPIVRGRAAVHEAELLVPRTEELYLPQTLVLAA